MQDDGLLERGPTFCTIWSSDKRNASLQPVKIGSPFKSARDLVLSLLSSGTTVGVPTSGVLSGISSQKEEHSVLLQMDTQEAADIPVLKQGKLKIINGVGIRHLVPNGRLQPFKDGCNLGCLNDETKMERAPAGRKTDCQMARTKKPLQLKIRSRKKGMFDTGL